jgi:hypothetical protein
MDALLPQIEKKVFIQIGTNDGNDNFNKYVRKFRPEITILL